MHPNDKREIDSIEIVEFADFEANPRKYFLLSKEHPIAVRIDGEIGAIFGPLRVQEGDDQRFPALEKASS